MRIDAEAKRRERIERGALALRPVLAFDQQKIGVKIQPPIGDDARLQRAQRSSGGIARIDGRRQALAARALHSGAERPPPASPPRRALQMPAAGPAFFSFSAEMLSGTLRMVRILEVTSSPVCPSPRVMPCSQPRAAVFRRLVAQRHAQAIHL